MDFYNEDMIKQAKQLLYDYEFYKDKVNDMKKANEIYLQLKLYKNKIHDEFYKKYYQENDNYKFLETYPDYNDPNFHQKIYDKKEFRKSKYPELDESKSFQELANQECKKDKFELTLNQKFLKNFISLNTPYDGILLFHGLGVGKTCSAITIAEQFIDHFKRPAIVLAPKGLHDNFKNQIYDGKSCTSKKYEAYISNKNLKDQNTINKEVKKIIKKRYKFFGFVSFSKYITKIELSAQKKYPNNPDKRDFEIFQKIYRDFSDRIIIIDEVHNTRTDETQKLKKDMQVSGKDTPLKIEKMLSIVKNVKLVLLSATPMYNSTTEIVTILNFLLANDKRPLINPNDVFNKDGELTNMGEKILEDHFKGYVSFMKARNPYSFPFKLYPNINNDPNLLIKNKQFLPKYDMYNNIIPNQNNINYLLDKIVINDLTNTQVNILKNTNFEIDYTTDDISDDNKNNVSQQLQVSNIVFPSNKIGVSGFNSCFELKKGEFNYKPFCQDFLSPIQLHEYSFKFKQIIDYILSSKGIVFVHSMYLFSAIIPLAIALEHYGFTKRNDSKKICKNARVYHNAIFENISRPKYTIITPNVSLNINKNTELKYINHENNKNGEQVKVVFGTQSAAEGLDLKNIRQIHIVEPWFHLNKIEQISGRGIRKCSHINLPIEERNVTLYLHASVNKKNPFIESTDIRTYRIAEQKKKNIDKIETLMIRQSVDCPLNFTRFKYLKSPNKTINMVTSQNNIITNYMYGDDDDDLLTNLTCKSNINYNKKINDSTFRFSMYEDDVDIYSGEIAKLFQIKPIMKFETIVLMLREKNSSQFIDEDVIKMTLDFMIKTKYEIENENRMKGFIVYYSDKYMFQPNKSSNLSLTKYERYNYKPKIVNRVSIKNKDVNAQINAENTQLMSKININHIKSIIEKANELKFNFKKTYNMDIKIDIFIDYLIDRMEINVMKQLVTEILLQKQETNLNIDLIYKSLFNGKYLSTLNNNVFFVRNIYAFKNSIELKKIVPLRNITSKSVFSSLSTKLKNFETISDSESYFIFKNEKLQPANNEELSLISQQSNLEFFNLDNLKGYMSLPEKSKSPNFKVTKNAEKNDGTVCTTFGNKDEIQQYIKQVTNNTEPIPQGQKKNLCYYLEIMYRNKNNMKYPIFLRPIDYFSSHIKKIIEKTTF